MGLALNPLIVNPTKWSNTLKQFIGNLPTNCLSVFDHFVKLALKGLKDQCSWKLISQFIFFTSHIAASAMKDANLYSFGRNFTLTMITVFKNKFSVFGTITVKESFVWFFNFTILMKFKVAGRMKNEFNYKWDGKHSLIIQKMLNLKSASEYSSSILQTKMY